VDDAGLPSFARTQAATDGERGVQVISYAFDLLHLDGQDTSLLPLIERKALLDPLVTNKPGLQFNGHDAGDGELILKHGKVGFEGVVSKTTDAPYAPGNRGLWRKAKAPASTMRRTAKTIAMGALIIILGTMASRDPQTIRIFSISAPGNNVTCY
jgi:ATP-dependent DNA ligase